VISTGDKVFFADNSRDYLERGEAYARTARALGLVPVFWGGAGVAVRQSNQDSEIRNDFYNSRAAVLYFGAAKDSSNPEDHWVLPELKHFAASGADCLVYVSEDFPSGVLPKYGYAGQPRVLSGGHDFGTVLQNDLKRLMGDQA